MSTKKLIEFYSSINNVQLFYALLGLFYLMITLFYSVLIIPMLKHILLWVFSIVLFLFKLVFMALMRVFRCKCFKSGPSSSHSLHNSSNMNINGLFKRVRFSKVSNSVKFKKLRTSLGDDDDEEDAEQQDNDDFVSRALNQNDDCDTNESNEDETNANKSKKFFYLFLFMLFIYGCVMSNFILFMNNYLITRLSVAYFYQIELTSKLFYSTFILVRLLAFVYMSCIKSSTKNEQFSISPANKLSTRISCLNRIKLFINKYNMVNLLKHHLVFSLILVKLMVLSYLQLFSSNYIDNIKYYIFNKRNSEANASALEKNGSFDNIKLNLDTFIVFGFMYPFLLAMFMPFLFKLAQDTTTTCLYKLDGKRPAKYITRLMTYYVTPSILIGFICQSIASNYLIKLFLTQNLFIYSNIINTSLFFVAIGAFSFTHRANSNISRFMSLNEMKKSGKNGHVNSKSYDYVIGDDDVDEFLDKSDEENVYININRN